MTRLLVFGATSAIAQALIRLYATDGARLFLVARNPGRLEAVADDARVRGAGPVETRVMDARDHLAHHELIESASAALEGLDVVLIAHGTLPDQGECERDVEQLREAFETNCLGVVSIATHAANFFEARGAGTLAVISSVAGDRGRASNYVYGAAKAGVDAFLSGLRGRLHRAGVSVLTVKPGFVDTPMTAAFRKGPLWASPETVARGIRRAIERKRDVVYLPGWWWGVMWVIRHIPERIFKRLGL